MSDSLPQGLQVVSPRILSKLGDAGKVQTLVEVEAVFVSLVWGFDHRPLANARKQTLHTLAYRTVLKSGGGFLL